MLLFILFFIANYWRNRYTTVSQWNLSTSSSHRTGECCVYKFFRRSVDKKKHLMRFQSESSVFKFLGRNVDGAMLISIHTLREGSIKYASSKSGLLHLSISFARLWTWIGYQTPVNRKAFLVQAVHKMSHFRSRFADERKRANKGNFYKWRRSAVGKR